jgi:hypothetical protein
VTKRGRQAGWTLALLPLVLVLAGCSSGGGGSGATTATYLTAVGGCAKQSIPVVCLETADHKLGDAIHRYANVLATGRAFTAPRADVSTTLNEAQLLANSLEILGDAQPTQANYNQVLNTFNVNSAITQLQGDVTTLAGSLGK